MAASYKGTSPVPGVRRAFTLPTRMNQAYTQSQEKRLNGPEKQIETLFAHSGARIVSFTTRANAEVSWKTPGDIRNNSEEQEAIGTLPWRTDTDRLLAAGPLSIYRVPGSVAFLNAGSFLKPILAKSQCWCVDGEGIFILKRGLHDYYRIELSNDDGAGEEAAKCFGDALSQILRYETTPCPFKRGFYVEVPESPQITYVPWRPKHRPISPIRYETRDSLSPKSRRPSRDSSSGQRTRSVSRSSQASVDQQSEDGLLAMQMSRNYKAKASEYQSIKPRIGKYETLDQDNERDSLQASSAITPFMERHRLISRPTSSLAFPTVDFSASTPDVPKADPPSHQLIKDKELLDHAAQRESQVIRISDDTAPQAYSQAAGTIIGILTSAATENRSRLGLRDQADGEEIVSTEQQSVGETIESAQFEIPPHDYSDQSDGSSRPLTQDESITGYIGLDVQREIPSSRISQKQSSRMALNTDLARERSQSLNLADGESLDKNLYRQVLSERETGLSKDDQLLIQARNLHDTLSAGEAKQALNASESSSSSPSSSSSSSSAAAAGANDGDPYTTKADENDETSVFQPYMVQVQGNRRRLESHEEYDSSDSQSVRSQKATDVTHSLERGHELLNASGTSLEILTGPGFLNTVEKRSGSGFLPCDPEQSYKSSEFALQSPRGGTAHPTPSAHGETKAPTLSASVNSSTVQLSDNNVKVKHSLDPVGLASSADGDRSENVIRLKSDVPRKISNSDPQPITPEDSSSDKLPPLRPGISRSYLPSHANLRLPQESYERVGAAIGQKMATILLGPPLHLATLMLRIATRFTNGVRIKDLQGEGWKRRSEAGRKLPGMWEYYSEDEYQTDEDLEEVS